MMKTKIILVVFFYLCTMIGVIADAFPQITSPNDLDSLRIYIDGDSLDLTYSCNQQLNAFGSFTEFSNRDIPWEITHWVSSIGVDLRCNKINNHSVLDMWGGDETPYLTNSGTLALLDLDSTAARNVQETSFLHQQSSYWILIWNTTQNPSTAEGPWMTIVDSRNAVSSNHGFTIQQWIDADNGNWQPGEVAVQISNGGANVVSTHANSAPNAHIDSTWNWLVGYYSEVSQTWKLSTNDTVETGSGSGSLSNTTADDYLLWGERSGIAADRQTFQGFMGVFAAGNDTLDTDEFDDAVVWAKCWLGLIEGEECETEELLFNVNVRRRGIKR